MRGTTFEKYGGFKTVSRIVMSFYDLVLDSDTVGHHFDDVDMPRLIDHQTKFVSGLMGGPAQISDERLRVVHNHLTITDDEFDEIINLLRQALESHGMETADVDSVEKQMESKRNLIVHVA